MIRLLLGLHPRRWRRRYGDEFRTLLESEPLTARTVVDVLRNAGRQHARVHRRALAFLAALTLSFLVEVVALRQGLTVNILWAPSTPARAAVLLAVLAPWVAVTADAVRARRTRHSLQDRT